jgi:hypothetical protein
VPFKLPGRGEGEVASNSISFPLRLASAPVVDELSYGETDAHRKGSKAAPPPPPATSAST